jgi:hypothetical protein
MKRKLWSFLLIMLFFTPGFFSTVQSIPLSYRFLSCGPLEEAAPNSPSLPSLTVGKIVSMIENELQRMPVNAQMKTMLLTSLKQGVAEMGTTGVTTETTLSELKEILDHDTSFRLRGSHRFLMNFYPDVAQVVTVLPRYTRNLSETNESQNRTLEIFIKLIPFYDYIKTENRIIVRILCQSSIIWPAIGMRILEGNTTVFIFACSPGIQWSWKLF